MEEFMAAFVCVAMVSISLSSSVDLCEGLTVASVPDLKLELERLGNRRPVHRLLLLAGLLVVWGLAVAPHNLVPSDLQLRVGLGEQPLGLASAFLERALLTGLGEPLPIVGWGDGLLERRGVTTGSHGELVVEIQHQEVDQVLEGAVRASWMLFVQGGWCDTTAILAQGS